MTLRILGLSEGNDQSAMSGVAGYVFAALERQGATVQRLDYSPAGIARLGLGALSFRPSRGAWLARFHTSRAAHSLLSRTLASRAKEETRSFDVALQIHGWVNHQPTPYTLYVDQTRLMAERGWPRWIPFAPRERATMLARESQMYERAAHVFTMGTPSRDSLVDDYGVDPEKISVVGGGLNLAALPPPRQPSLEPTVLFVGRDFERKGGDWLLESFELARREVPNATLHMVGVKRPIRQRGVIDHGRLSDRSQLTALYESARVFCMPSRYEPWGLVFAEAMAHSVPCIGSNVQSIPEILDHGRAGKLVARDDTEGLAAVLVELLTDDHLAVEIGANGRRLVEASQTWDHVARRMEPHLLKASGRTP